MHALVVLGHPEPRSFNGQLKDVACETLRGMGYSVEVSDLCAQRFDPLEDARHYASRANPDLFDAQVEQRHAHETGTISADVSAEIEKLDRADLLILQYPMWWFTMPAILKGWLDRVMVYGGVYTSGMRYDRGRFRGRRAMLSVTTGGPAATFAHNGRNGDIELLLWPMHFTLHYLGYSVLPPFVAYGIEGGLKYSDPLAIPSRLQGYKDALALRLRGMDGTTPLSFSGWNDWDENGQLKPGVSGHSLFMRENP